MPDYTVSGDVDSMLRSANDAGIRSAIGVGTTDAPTFLGLSVTGQSLISNGTATNPGIAFASNLDTGIRTIGGADLRLTVDGYDAAIFSQTQLNLQSNFASIVLGSSGAEAILTKDAAGILAQRNGTNAQAFRVYNTFPGTTANEWFEIDWKTTTNSVRIGTNHAGTGGSRQMILTGGGGSTPGFQFNVGAAATWIIDQLGAFKAGFDNQFDIGASGANRPRNVYVAANTTIGDLATANGALTLQATSLPQLILTSTLGTNAFHGLNINAGGSPRAGFLLNMSSGEIKIGALSSSGYFPTIYSNNAEVMRFTIAGLVGIGTTTPSSKLTVTGGDIEVATIASGLILKSPDGTRYRVTAANGGTLSVAAV